MNYFIFSVYIAQFEEYTLPLINHLVERKVGHWDTVIRELTAKVNLLLFLHMHVYVYVCSCNIGNGIFNFETVFSEFKILVTNVFDRHFIILHQRLQHIWLRPFFMSY